MPTTIPFDHPSLVLGNIINPLILTKLKQISGLQNKIDAAQDQLNSQIALKRSIKMTINEMVDMEIDVTDLTAKVSDIDTAIKDAAKNYTAIRLNNETEIQNIKGQLLESEIDDTIESPLDYSTLGTKNMKLASDSLKLDAQYFSYEDDNSSGSMSTIENYIKESTASLGNQASSEIVKTASGQISQQKKNHSLAGTLIITATCTHRSAKILWPCNIDVDKAIPAWNKMFPTSKIDSTSQESLDNIAQQAETSGADSFSVLSGATYGSSFVGMVHMLKQNNSSNNNNSFTGSTNGTNSDSSKNSNANGNNKLIELAASLQERLTIGNWLKEASGGFGIDSSIAEDIRSTLNNQKVLAHITLVVMGAVPSIKSNQLQATVSDMTKRDPKNITAEISSISGTTASQLATVEQGARAAKTGANILAIQNANIQGIMSSLGKIDQDANKTLDINSMLAAFENYLEQVKNEDSGVPINFYLKTISRQQLAQLYLDKNFGNKNDSIPAAVIKTN